MPVYVDHARIPYGRMKMSHMVADTDHELQAMVKIIGLAQRHHQTANSGTPHYDVSDSYRTKAVNAGAVEVTQRQLGKKLKHIRDAVADGSYYEKPPSKVKLKVKDDEPLDDPDLTDEDISAEGKMD